MRQPLENQRQQGPAARPGGFTLVELLITITIVGILAGVVLAAVQSARETAKAAKTKATITKLHYIIMARYDSYRTRRVPIDIAPGITDLKQAAADRLNALRDLMRMEMPDRWSDVTNNTESTAPAPDDHEVPLSLLNAPQNTPPSITYRFFRLYRDAVNREGLKKVQLNAAAECLYMIVMSIPEAAEQFQNTEIGDVDGDGLKEFIDGWGHPIFFLRWPAGFLEGNYAISDLQDGTQPDPFDPYNLTAGRDYATYPLIFSAGPDGNYDIYIQSDYEYQLTGGYLHTFVDVPHLSGNSYRIGQPVRSIDDTTVSVEPEDLRHYDNITNHMLEVR